MNGEEMMDDYGLRFNAPKNFKNGRLIGNRYRIIDLVIVLAGASLSALSLILYITGSGDNVYPWCTLLCDYTANWWSISQQYGASAGADPVCQSKEELSLGGDL